MEKEYKQKEIKEIAKLIINHSPSKKICFHGEMGAGKTTLIKAIVKELGGQGEASSPTFGIVNEYNDAQNNTLAYHFDFYRLNDESEALDFGVEDYLYSNHWVFMEWPDKIRSLIPEDATHLSISIRDTNTRILKIPS
ncbi:tRNA (adenosine(37)-N6)-threonylcarbamoyltransferase complex ATPase subunit type 1 TsaE [Cellulophaga sp. HaHa_2_1]|uniref:tRNA (adenosine(37)-N6)-threonylcarbamoyltransferase complex ATPase subunit type 1 TsaE n=1 Tax=Cellulophaga sp. HaHa_2_1 TaxID=2749994 RepID=UPI001C4F9472|nr:tRNA (adenosine(37)-N6)-threonylcarbamoyltransferase complex ATPase subunit type 1 TsaE [Cellulophaga sp. HaHa_2_1]QXP53359.1 tRNA (adenosine(37)-N6)-threonylcarbamoyltransferase complex ATPase subunit type 1 TsaE [Cellulophaga sp. HaHa_2_1]